MAACCPPGMPDIANDLPGLHLLTGSDADGGAVGVQRFQPAAVVDLDVVTVTAAPAVKTVGNGDGSICGGEDWRTLGAGNVGAGVGTNFASNGVNTVAKLRGNCSCDRKLPLQSVCWGAGAVRGHKFTTTLGNAAGQFRP